MNWSITYDGKTWDGDSLTVRHARIVSEILRDDSWSWVALSPERGPLALLAVLVAFVSVDRDYSPSEAIELVETLSSMRLNDLIDCLEVHEEA